MIIIMIFIYIVCSAPGAQDSAHPVGSNELNLDKVQKQVWVVRSWGWKSPPWLDPQTSDLLSNGSFVSRGAPSLGARGQRGQLMWSSVELESLSFKFFPFVRVRRDVEPNKSVGMLTHSWQWSHIIYILSDQLIICQLGTILIIDWSVWRMFKGVFWTFPASLMWIFPGFFTLLWQKTEYIWVGDKTKRHLWLLLTINDLSRKVIN